MSLLSWTAFAHMYRDGRDCNPAFFEFKNNYSTYYQTAEEYQRIKDVIEQKVKENPHFIEQRLGEIAKSLPEDIRQLREINKKLKNKPDLSKLFFDYWELFRRTIFGMAIDNYFDDVLGGRLKNYLKTKLSEVSKVNEYYAILSSSVKLTTTQKEEIDFLEILSKSKIYWQKLFKKHLEKYSYLPMWFDGQSWDIYDLNKRAVVFNDKKEIKKRWRTLKNEIDLIKKKKRKIIKELNMPVEIKKMVENIQEFSYLRQQGEVQISYHNFQGRFLKKMVAKKLDIKLNDLVYLTDEEIIDGLKNRKSSFSKKIRERKKYCFIIMRDGKYKIYTGLKAKKEVQKIKSKIINERASIKKQYKGVVGSVGYARGRAYVMKNLSDVDKINDQEIMVVSGTSVEYLTAMKKAVAVIAEIGGITSHAAVICREMKKPCLIQVENATKIFKNGDLVEVDAINGTAKILDK